MKKLFAIYIQCGILYFGAPRWFLSDNVEGGNLIMNEKLNIKTFITTVKSPICNGTVEHYNLIVAAAMEKTLEDEKCELEITLAWAVSAKNALQNHSGHSPNELVFGFNINTPSVLTDQLLALKAATTSDMVRVNLNVLHAARKSFREANQAKKF